MKKQPKSKARQSYAGPGPVGSVSGIKPPPATLAAPAPPAPHPPPGPFVPAYGPVPSPLYVLGERPGDTEAREGRPFVGDSGQVLAQWFDRADLDLDNFRRWNVCNDFKHGNPDPAAWEMARDREAVIADMMASGCTIVAAVGAYAVRWCLGPGYDLDTVHGIPHRSDWLDCIVIPVYHPANSFYKVELAAQGQADVMAVARVLRGRQGVIIDQFAEPDYRELNNIYEVAACIKAK